MEYHEETMSDAKEETMSDAKDDGMPRGNYEWRKAW